MKPWIKKMLENQGVDVSSPEKEQEVIRQENMNVQKRLADVSAQQQRMGDQALYQNRVFDEQSADLARQKNKENQI